MTSTATAPFSLHNDPPIEAVADFPHVIRRDIPGDASGKPRVVAWLGHKIARAVARRRSPARRRFPSAGRCRRRSSSACARSGPLFVHIEQLQDLVEETLIELGHGKVALAYGKYRARRAAVRELEGDKVAVDEGQLELATREQLADLRARISFARIGLNLTLTENDLVARLLRSASLNLTAEERRDTIILNAKSLLDVDADARFFAARILLTYIYEETLPWKVADGIRALKEAHRNAPSSPTSRTASSSAGSTRASPSSISQKLADALDPFADLQFDFIGIQTLYDRYLIHAHDTATGRKRRLEAPQIFWMRVAMGLALGEQDRERARVEFYGIYKTRRACSSTPTLFNAGTLHPQLSCCYLLYCGDSHRGNHRDLAPLLASLEMGGRPRLLVDGDPRHRRAHPRHEWRMLRRHPVPQGQQRHRHRREPGRQTARRALLLSRALACRHRGLPRSAQGDRRRPPPHAQHEHGALDSRPVHEAPEGASPMACCRRTPPGRSSAPTKRPTCRSFTAAPSRPRYLQLRALAEEGKIWSRKVRVLALWKKMLETLFETGHPWMTFKDPCNVRSPQDHVGVIHNSNLCTEITLNTSMRGSGGLQSRLHQLAAICATTARSITTSSAATITVVMRMLDNVIDINFYPRRSRAQLANQRHRPVGLGVMGMQDALYDKRIAFDTPEAVDFNDEMLEAIAFYAYDASQRSRRRARPLPELHGLEVGPRHAAARYARPARAGARRRRSSSTARARLDWDGLREKIARQGMRNSNCLAIAPTATISNILGCTPCIEPTYKHIHTKSNLCGEFIRTNDHLLRDLQARGLWDEEMLADLKYFDGSVQAIERIPDGS